jgi:hypothetical protein
MAKKPKRPRDSNELAHFIISAATGEAELPEKQEPEKNPAAVALGKLGGLKGGKARAEKLTPKRRREIAVKAAKKRWQGQASQD